METAGPPLLGEFAETAAEKFVAILNHQTRAHFRKAFRTTEASALEDGVGATAATPAGTVAESIVPVRPQPLAGLRNTSWRRHVGRRRVVWPWGKVLEKGMRDRMRENTL